MNIKNILNFFKTDEEIRQSMTLKEIVPILKQNLVDAKEKDEVLIFKITKIKKSGFEVKVKGIFAFVPFSLMPWKYYANLWYLIEKELIDYKFFAKISEIDIVQNRIILDARITEFDEFYLQDGNIYKAIIIKKSRNYVIVELGHRYNWNYGSQAFYVSLDSPNYIEIDHSIHSISDEIDLTFIESANNWKKINFDKVEYQSQSIETLDEFKFEKITAEKNLNKIQNDNYNLSVENKEKHIQINSIKQKNILLINQLSQLKQELEKEKIKSNLFQEQLSTALNSNKKDDLEKTTKMLENLKILNKNQQSEIIKLIAQLHRKQEAIDIQEKLITFYKNNYKE